MKSIRVFKQIIKDIIYDHSKPIVNSNFNLLLNILEKSYPENLSNSIEKSLESALGSNALNNLKIIIFKNIEKFRNCKKL